MPLETDSLLKEDKKSVLCLDTTKSDGESDWMSSVTVYWRFIRNNRKHCHPVYKLTPPVLSYIKQLLVPLEGKNPQYLCPACFSSTLLSCTCQIRSDIFAVYSSYHDLFPGMCHMWSRGNSNWRCSALVIWARLVWRAGRASCRRVELAGHRSGQDRRTPLQGTEASLGDETRNATVLPCSVPLVVGHECWGPNFGQQSCAGIWTQCWAEVPRADARGIGASASVSKELAHVTALQTPCRTVCGCRSLSNAWHITAFIFKHKSVLIPHLCHSSSVFSFSMLPPTTTLLMWNRQYLQEVSRWDSRYLQAWMKRGIKTQWRY